MPTESWKKKTLTQIRVFISCPGDVVRYKNIVKDLCDSVSREKGNHLGFELCFIDWRNIVGYHGPTAQAIINESIKGYEVYIGIMGNRFGSPTGNYNRFTKEAYPSGTVEEYEHAKMSYNLTGIPIINILFKDSKNVRTTHDVAQVEQVIKFQESIRVQHQWLDTFKGPSDFTKKVRAILCQRIEDFDNRAKLEAKKAKSSLKRIKRGKNPLSLDIKLPPDYIPRKLIHYRDLIARKKLFDWTDKSQPLTQIVVNCNRVVVLGSAGSGKTYELHKLVADYSIESSKLIPIYSSLNKYVDESIESILPTSWKKIPPQSCLIILDGFDEIQSQHVNTAVRKIQTFSEKYPDSKIVISCRTNFYNLPVNGSQGTLPDFEPYFLIDLNVKTAADHVAAKYNVTSSDFFTEVVKKNYVDLAHYPFFLNLLGQEYSKKGALHSQRVILFENYLSGRLESDSEKYLKTANGTNPTERFHSLLEKIALSMEMLGRNFIHEGELLKLIDSTDIDLLKFSTVFLRKTSEERTWQFEHNNLQEYYASRVLMRMKLDRLLELVTFDRKRIKPTWLNTISFLFSNLLESSDLFKGLLEWIVENESEIIVKFEPAKVSDALRIAVFQGIVSRYRDLDVWINSNKFNTQELALFGSTDQNFEFLLKEIDNNNATRIGLMNAIHILGDMENLKEQYKPRFREVILKCVRLYKEDPSFVHSAIYSLTSAKLIDDVLLSILLREFGDNKNDEVRSSLYFMLVELKKVDENIDVFIDGYEINESRSRSNSVFLNESWNLRNGFKAATTPDAIKRILNYIILSKKFYNSHEASSTLIAVVENATIAYEEDITIYSLMKRLFEKFGKRYDDRITWDIVLFFEKTDTKENLFRELFYELDRTKFYGRRLLSFLASNKTIHFIIDKYKSQEISESELEDFYYALRSIGRGLEAEFEKEIKANLSLNLKFQAPTSNEEYWKNRRQTSFDLLFEPDKLKHEVLRIFEVLKKDRLVTDDLYELRHRNKEIDVVFLDSALSLLRSWGRNNKEIKKKDIQNWMNKKDRFADYRIGAIYDNLTNIKEIELNTNQIKILSDWCTVNVEKVNFTKAIKVKGESISITTKAIYLWYFYRRLNLQFPENVLLDMLSFDSYYEGDFVGIEYLTKKLPKEKVERRIVKNVVTGISSVEVLKNHLNYIMKHKMTSKYSLVRKEILDSSKKDYFRCEMVRVYATETRDVKGLKEMLIKADPEIRWDLVKVLIELRESTFLVPVLQGYFTKAKGQEEKVIISKYQIRAGDIEALKFYITWLKTATLEDVDSHSFSFLYDIKKIEAVPVLLDLLETCYRRDIKLKFSERLASTIVDVIYNIGISSQENLTETSQALKEFVECNLTKYTNIKFLKLTIERMEQQFYMEQGKLMTIPEVITQLSTLEEVK
jgi:hypothetical protein